MIHISIKPEIVFHFLGFPVTNSLITSTSIVIVFFILSVYFYYASMSGHSKLVFFVRFLISKLYDLFKPISKEKTDELFPFFASLFLFIILSNWLGLFPGVGSIIIREGTETIPLLRGSTADLNTTLGLGLTAFVLIQFYGFKFLGFNYLKKFISLGNPIAFFTGILEIISEFSKIISFAFRLFGNIFAGEVLITVVAFLIPALASFPFLVLEIFVGFIQALVFSMLAAVFISVATAEHH
ncbi:ATP synthase F0 subunit A [Candidatus Roizmanbacteria bacterium RIFCSPHIGHO2_01_FULL_38_41]|uniref:ATP synthase subunit a n=1 Tax=Candidatus Roizmanbacteria bacterium RIFCSPHIGHO2_02_FULL_37_24 TaxID=1802037 RepID=A0A1F7GXF2_9BACT|nr:MAG: ATP synthase F0 subunit A [Candidatus Roizmanbacteria bacterium RIFCSPHIGHO2_01_FULL_38_41]OGK23750.1 MAG: ATP synthase F0 subunit A [Candidatus Roizmanbacteria bacterium RIFCSPHIGHO2_02_FULL_37_24]OGK32677.1 MAG: ATP synthase F0 subunit A [Candidatus Roizmanbacteria bacterium RIFCSPHIGHO2_12_FULL_37_23]